MMDPNKITNLKDMATYIAENTDRICVGVDHTPLSKLSGGDAVRHAMGFIARGQLPLVETVRSEKTVTQK